MHPDCPDRKSFILGNISRLHFKHWQIQGVFPLINCPIGRKLFFFNSSNISSICTRRFEQYEQPPTFLSFRVKWSYVGVTTRLQRRQRSFQGVPAPGNSSSGFNFRFVSTIKTSFKSRARPLQYLHPFFVLRLWNGTSNLFLQV